ncbi:Bardet-Biedl syndrome 1 protein [Histomonas meleagridis]|uniref:Bardet-Biedl syndrome 1 protein n=1 Tax=Histomonas meleagridis TaxID=135588 RepID=UPI00355A5CF2|nr:Bardet-Biedl syndrome 1 protein [Histomonas meleagridis]KAH0797263.1 Bardet-Biedl syndrome 1 protein [Histomonas meleagridis]
MKTNELFWRIAFSDKTTGIAAIPQCLTAGNVFGDGDNRILIATLDQKILCFEGPRITHEKTLPELPSSICVHHSGKSTNTLIPLVAVGCGNSVLFFLNMREYSKFTLPPPFKSDEEMQIYQKFIDGNLTIGEMRQEILTAKEKGSKLCRASISLLQADLSTPSSIEHQLNSLKEVTTSDCVTALSTIKCNAINDDNSTRLLVGTESRSILMLDSTDRKVERRWDLGAPPSVIRTSGYLTGTSLVAVISRDRILRLITNLSEHPTSISCESFPIDIAICSGYIYVALMSKLVKIFDSIGKHIGTVAFDEHIVSLSSIDIETYQFPCCCVSTSSGEITFLNKEERISTQRFEEGISAMYFGKVGREPYNLLTMSKHGGLYLRTFSRMQTPSSAKANEPEQIQPIPIPKKSKLFLSNCENERNNSAEEYNEWCNSIRYLRLLAAKTYAKICEDSVASPIEDVSFNTKIFGMGPEYIMNVSCVNSGKEALTMMKIIPMFNKEIFSIEPDCVTLPLLVGGYKYTAKFVVKAKSKSGKSDFVKVIAISPDSVTPLCSALVNVPVSQFPVL